MNKTEQKIPALRFPEFKGEWVEKRLGEIASKPEYGLNTPAVEYDGVNGYIRITDIDENSNCFIAKNKTSPKEYSDAYVLKKGDLLFARTGASVGKSYLYSEEDGKLFFAGFLIRFPITNANSHFVFYQTLRERFRKWTTIMSARSGQPGVNAEEYASFQFLLPTSPEQQKIADFLSAVDKRLQSLKDKKTKLEEYKCGVMQRIFSQELRFTRPDGSAYPDWEEKRLGNILLLRLRPIDKPENSYWRLGVRSHAKGTFYEEVLNPDSVQMDTLYEVKANDIVVNITFAWEHAIALASKEDEGKLVSHRFPTYTINDSTYPLFLKYIIQRKEFKNELYLISPGGAGRNRVLNRGDFLKILLSLPCLDEQHQIADFLSSIDDKIVLLTKQIESTEQYKKGLLQQLFV